MRFLIIAICMAGTAATAQSGLNMVCSGWATDRLMLTVVSQKNREMIAALDAIEDQNPAKPLARKMVENLEIITEAMKESMGKTGAVQTATCP